MRNWKIIIILVAIAILLSFGVAYVRADDTANSTVLSYNFINNTVASPIRYETFNSTPYYLYQGDTAYIGQMVDVSGVTPPYQYLAYWDGFDMYDDNATYKINMWEKSKQEYYNFFIDPEIFGNRTGRWYKYSGTYERAGNNLAFVVAYPKPIMTNTTNVSYQNPNQTPIILPIQPVLPVRHIADYLVARGYNFTIDVNRTANVWIFGSQGYIYDYQSDNNTINMTGEMMSDLQAGDYKVLIQFPRNDTNDFMIRYNPNESAIEWFDSKTFSISSWSTLGQTPENVLYQLETVFPQTRDTFMLFKLAIWEPMVTVNQIDVMNQLNETRRNTAGALLEPASYVDVRGYTNLPPDTPIIVMVNPSFNLTGEASMGDGFVATSTEGTVGGDMRTFKAIVPVHLYNLPLGRNFIGVKVPGTSLVTTADFYIYGSPDGNFVPNKTMRYVSGKYGPEEIVPTPTPIVVEKVVTQVVTQIVTVEVTPSDEQVHAQQEKVTQEREMYWGVTIALYGGIIFTLFLVGRFVFRALKRRAWLKK